MPHRTNIQGRPMTYQSQITEADRLISAQGAAW